MATNPTLPTIKRLFAVSSNRCAFEKCDVTIINKGTVVGHVCHIEARNPGGPRYNPTQSEEERNGFDNLVLMCPVHHTVIDSDVESYTVPRLKEIKANHEARAEQTLSIDD